MAFPKKQRTESDPGVPASSGFRSLLVPVDLTPASDRVLARLTRLPLEGGARVTLLHVVPGSLPPVAQRRAVQDAEGALADEAMHLRTQLDRSIRVESMVRVGAAASEIAAGATAVDAELIVVGRGGGRALRDTFLGSTAERVVRQTLRPVLLVRLPARSAYRRPALALDLDRSAHEVVRLLCRVLPPPRPRIDVVHAYEIPYQGWIYPSLTEDESELMSDELRVKATRELGALLAASVVAANVPPGEGPPWKIHVHHGSPRRVVEKVTKKAETDLLVLGTHGYSGAAYVFLGTIAGDLLRAAKCDVLIVPPAPARE